MSNSKKKQRLINIFGDRCFWCGEVMDQPKYGEPDEFNENMVTLEHHIQKEKQSKLDMHLKLAHRRCNI